MPPISTPATPLIDYQPDRKPPLPNYNIAQRTYAARNYCDLGISAVEVDAATAEAAERAGLELRPYRTLTGDVAVRTVGAVGRDDAGPTTLVEPTDPIVLVVTMDKRRQRKLWQGPSRLQLLIPRLLTDS